VGWGDLDFFTAEKGTVGLALKAGITQATLSSIERGRAIPHISTRQKIETE